MKGVVNMFKKARKWLSVIGMVVCLVSTSVLTASAASAKVVSGSGFSGVSYDNWAQAMSKYSSMRSSGCRIVTFLKMLYEAGYREFTDPDKFYEWGVSKGYFKSTCGELTSFGKVVLDYVKSKGGSASIVATKSINGYSDTNASTVMNYLRNGYYVTLSCSAHTTYVARNESLQKGYPVLYDSSYSAVNKKWYGTYGSKIAWKDYSNTRTFTNIRAFYISTPSAEASPNNSESKPAASTLSVNVSNPPSVFKCPGTFNLKGSIKSNYNITVAQTWITNSKGAVVAESTIKPNSKSIDIQSSNLNKKLSFSKIKSAGSYVLHVYAKDASGRIIDKKYSFTAKKI